jgi:hypothetical protein
MRPAWHQLMPKARFAPVQPLNPLPDRPSLLPRTSWNSSSRDRLESRWAGWIARLLLTRSAENETFHPRSAGSRDHELEPLRSFQTVSPRNRVNKGMKKDRSVEAPILPPPARCASFLEQRSSTSRRTLQGGLSHREFTYLLGGYLPIDSPPPFYGGALQLDRVVQRAYLRVSRPRCCRCH